jgi:hypothetical protein
MQQTGGLIPPSGEYVFIAIFRETNLPKYQYPNVESRPVPANPGPPILNIHENLSFTINFIWSFIGQLCPEVSKLLFPQWSGKSSLSGF